MVVLSMKGCGCMVEMFISRRQAPRKICNPEWHKSLLILPYSFSMSPIFFGLEREKKKKNVSFLCIIFEWLSAVLTQLRSGSVLLTQSIEVCSVGLLTRGKV